MSIIYHYCNCSTFLSIVGKGKLWLSAINNMNDYLEATWLGHALHAALQEKVSKKEIEQKDAEDFFRIFQSNNLPRFICCFSKEGDSLSQWRAYAEDGLGVAIGFDTNKLGIPNRTPTISAVAEHRIGLVNVSYQTLENLTQKMSSILDDVFKSENRQLVLFAQLAQLASSIKNPAFREEKEVRIIYAPMVMGVQKDNSTVINFEGLSEIYYRIASGFLSSYFEYEFKSDALVSIVLGPKNKFSDYDIDTFLGLHKLGHVEKSRSKASYR